MKDGDRMLVCVDTTKEWMRRNPVAYKSCNPNVIIHHFFVGKYDKECNVVCVELSENDIGSMCESET